MSQVRTFRAATMQAALDVVRRELGADAVILHTRQIEKKRLLPWRKPLQEVEITAGVGVNVRPSRAVAQRTDSAEAATATVSRAAASATTTAEPPASKSVRPASRRPSRDAADDPEPRAFDSLTRSLNRISNDLEAVYGASSPPGRGATTPAVAGPVSLATDEFAAKLDAIQKLLEDLSRSNLRRAGDDVPADLFALYAELVDAEVDDDLARDLVQRLHREATPQQRANPQALRTLLAGLVQNRIRCAAPIVPRSGQRRVVALVGPTGVGKTTTIAKLAAEFRLRNGMKMGLVTVDTYRIAAVDQLRTYAEIIDLPMKVVSSPLEMRCALDELAGLDLVLIDTAGRSPRDAAQLQELKQLLTACPIDEVHLVLSLTASRQSLASTARQFAAANATSLILTKLDEATGLGSVLSLAESVDLPISYLTTGQDVPDDIEPARPDRIARLILGQERIPTS